jgi:hypothetical protein
MTTKSLIAALIVLWVAFAALTFFIPAPHVFHCINAIAIAAGATTIYAYAPSVREAWRHRDRGISDGTMLALGVVTNWTGLLIRLGRWYVTDATPVADGIAAWAYNVGLWISICGAALLVGALASSPPEWSRGRILAHSAAFLALAVLLLQIDFAFHRS